MSTPKAAHLSASTVSLSRNIFCFSHPLRPVFSLFAMGYSRKSINCGYSTCLLCYPPFLTSHVWPGLLCFKTQTMPATRDQSSRQKKSTCTSPFFSLPALSSAHTLFLFSLLSLLSPPHFPLFLLHRPPLSKSQNRSPPMTPTDIKPPPSKTYFQEFRVPGEKEHTLIPVLEHPITNDLYVIWSDITDCFPGVAKIQYANVYVPKLRDTRLYRYALWVNIHRICLFQGRVLIE